MAINSGPRARAQHWACTIYLAYPDIEGLWYSSSMYGNEPAVALFERAATSLPATPFFDRPLNDPMLLPDIRGVARRIRYGVL